MSSSVPNVWRPVILSRTASRPTVRLLSGRFPRRATTEDGGVRNQAEDHLRNYREYNRYVSWYIVTMTKVGEITEEYADALNALWGDAAVRPSEHHPAPTATGVGTWHWDLVSGAVHWDDALHRIFGEEPGAFEGRFDEFMERVHADDRERVLKENQHAMEHLDEYGGNYRIVRADGAERLLMFKSRLYRDHGGKATGCLGIAWDATAAEAAHTESRIAAERAHEVLQFTQSILQTVHQPLLALDRDLRVLAINRAFCGKFGVAGHNAVGKLLYEIVDDRWNIPELRKLLSEVLPSKKAVEDFKVQYESTQGRRTLSLNAMEMYLPGNHATTILLSIDDVTRRDALAETARKGQDDLKQRLHRSEQSLAVSHAALSDTENMLVEFLECIPFGIFVCDRDGKPYYANKHAKAILGEGIVAGTSPDDFAETYQAYIEGTDTPYPTERMPIVQALAGATAASTDTEIQGPGGRTPLWISAAPVRDANDEIQYAIAVFQDVSKQRQLEGQLRQAQRMEAVGQLAGGVAHDFNNLLTAIFGFGNFALEALRPEDSAYKDLQEVLAAARRAETLTRQLLAFSRKQIVAPRVLNVAEHVSNMDKLLRRILGEDVEAATMLSDDLWDTKIDPGALEQVVVNLAVNARDAMPTGGKLTIEAVNVRLGDDYGDERGAEVPPGEYVCVAVSDTGCGMDAATQSKIFEPFYTTKTDGKGTGLGLATCYGIVKQAGGFIWVYSEVGKGTTFKVYLPRVHETRSSASDRPESPTPATGSEIVLIAEDDEQLRRSAVRALKGLGYEILEAANGGEAMLVGEEAPLIDLLLTDVVMPRMSGKLLADRLTRSHRAMKVLYMSGYTDDAIVHHGVLNDGIEFIQKPFTPHDLVCRVRTVLDSDYAPVSRRPSVLLVDDNLELLRSLQRKIAGDYDITLANGGCAARELLRRRDFDLVLCDITMPDLSGIELHEEMAKVRPSVAEHFVFMTGAGPDEIADFLSKTDIDVVSKDELATNATTVVARSLRPPAPVEGSA